MTRALACVVLIAALVGGCKDKKKDPAKSPATASGSAQQPNADNTPATPAPVSSGAAAKNADLAKLSVDSELVAGLDWQKLRASAVYKKVEQKLELDKQAEKFKKSCGFDPRDGFKSVTFGASNFEGEFRDKTEATFVVHGVDKKAVMACFDKHEAELKKDETTVTRDGDVVIVTSKGRERSLAFTFPKDDELFVMIGGKLDKAAVTARATGSSGLGGRPEFAALYDTVASGASIYIVMDANSKLLAKGQDLGVAAKGAVVQLVFGDNLAGDVRLRVNSPDDANNLAKGFQTQVAAIQGFVDKVEVKTEGADVHATAAASLEKLEAAYRMLFGK
jgi:hypothetical protein